MISCALSCTRAQSHRKTSASEVLTWWPVWSCKGLLKFSYHSHMFTWPFFLSVLFLTLSAPLCHSLSQCFLPGYLQHRASHPCWCGGLLWGGLWLHDPSNSYRQHPKLWVQLSSAWTDRFQAQWPQVWVDQSWVPGLVCYLRINFQAFLTVADSPMIAEIVSMKMWQTINVWYALRNNW